MQASVVLWVCRGGYSLGASKVYTLQVMSRKAEDPRCTLVELAESGRLSWKLIATEFIQSNSKDDVQDVLDTLIENY